MKKPRNLPSSNLIRSYWAPKLLHMGKTPNTGEIELQKPKVCFACGLESTVERAHIISKTNNGVDELDNLHLLCPICHKDSELLEPDEYAVWFQNRTPTDKLISLFFKYGGNLSDILHSISDRHVITSTIQGFLSRIQASLLEKEIHSSTSKRTIEALQSKKARGEKLGNFTTLEAHRGKQAKIKQSNAISFYEPILKRILRMRKQEFTLQEIADELNADGVKTKDGKKFYPVTISRIINREKLK